MTKGLWNELFLDNPVIKEAHRTIGTKIVPTSWRSNTVIAIVTVSVVYLTLLVMSLNAVKYMDASIFFYVTLTVSILAAVVVLYPGLAGEREKRTIDLLLVAPVTASQIVAAKVFRVVLPVLGIIVGLTLPAFVFGVARMYNGLEPISGNPNFAATVAGSVVLTLCVTTFVAGLTTFVSSVNRTTAGSLIGTLAVLFVVYIVYSVLAAAISSVTRDFSSALMSIHPYYALGRVIWTGGEGVNPWLAVTLTSVVHATLGCLLFVRAKSNVERERQRGSKSHA